ncbi:MAG: type 2 isopentenyl-diphosphate Delta-isomerase [Candidatus Heimdallarchaeum aukensis]|uniref:Isopentenyl-diphosphate delta-isomerase n=1 Tax=Candidatus Heimdallarchaeum aukensis TaxID=2876573 RepID=A0A9Y1FL12_9ARCH|nr:MAG: type 2 isopentenyl-diphosphate Delta-isomerase [Candidatus Heimdallarchaeum aukensis]
MPNKTSPRKDEHLKICNELDVNYDLISPGFEKVSISDELSNFSDVTPDMVKLETSLFGKKIDFPVIISGITGGSEEGKKINKSIAKVCNEFNIAMGVGSQRAAIEDPQLVSTYQVREYAPNIPLIGNLGVAQLLDKTNGEKVKLAVEMIDADAIALHINPLQEYVQYEGDKHFTNMIPSLRHIVQNSSFPIIIKGVGFGFSFKDMQIIGKIGAKYVDIAGAGGTNWTKIELYRHKKEFGFSNDFVNLGISTVETLRNAVLVQQTYPYKIIASGGIWSGINAVKALLLGADYVGLALPIVKAFYHKGEEGIKSFLSTFITEMKIVLAMMGIRDLSQLNKRKKKFLSHQ